MNNGSIIVLIVLAVYIVIYVMQVRFFRLCASTIINNIVEFNSDMPDYDIVEDYNDYIVDKEFYKRAETIMKNEEIRFIGTIENKKLSSKKPEQKTCILHYFDDKNNVLIGIYSMKNLNYGKKGDFYPEYINIYDMTTKTKEGQYYITTNAEMVSVFDVPESFSNKILDLTADFYDLYRVHLEHIKEIPYEDKMNIDNINEAIDLNMEMESKRLAFRQSIPYGVTKEEVHRLLMRSFSEKESNIRIITGKVYREIAVIRKKQNKMELKMKN